MALPGEVQMRSNINDAPYLEKVFDQDGAQVYKVRYVNAAHKAAVSPLTD
jgi:hypothetical protein